jgi:hypothetical protein
MHDQRPQFIPIDWRRLQPLEPLFGSAPQIELGNLEELIRIEVSHLSSHGESLRPIVNILVITPPKQLIHSLGISHLADDSLQVKIATLFTMHGPSNYNQVTKKLIGLSVSPIHVRFSRRTNIIQATL